jgi:hypothetical protein
MNRYELMEAVPAHDYEGEGRLFYVDLDEIPQPWREQFWAALYFVEMPVIGGVRRAAKLWDWQSWACSSDLAGLDGQ